MRLVQDIRFALRLVGRNPAFTTIAIATLALGIGINTTVFTFFNAFVLRPLPIRDPEALVKLNALDRNGRIRASPSPSIATSATATTYFQVSSRSVRSPFRSAMPSPGGPLQTTASFRLVISSPSG